MNYLFCYFIIIKIYKCKIFMHLLNSHSHDLKLNEPKDKIISFKKKLYLWTIDSHKSNLIKLFANKSRKLKF